MVENEVYFVEWMEEFVSQERGRRIVHYILKDSEAKSVLAVVGTERSLRHMVYVVADEFLSYAGPDNPIQAGFKWRSRREVVDWLTSMLAKQQTDSPRDSTNCLGSGTQRFCIANKVDHRVRHLKQSYSDIVWLGASWFCGKQLKHFPAFCRNGTTIAAQSFVFVMAKEENRYVAYLEDMYEDKKGQKKVKVRWFHHSQEVKGIVRLRNAHPKEVYITPYTQVISVECVDGPAIVLTRDHFEKCIGDFPDGLLGKVHLCFRQFRSNKIKPFDLSKLRGYFDQPLVSCLQSSTFPNFDSGVKVPGKGEYIGKGTKRVRNSVDQESFLASYDADEGRWKKIIRAPFSRGCYSAPFDKKHRFSRNVEIQKCHSQLFKVDDKVELLCQDSGIRGCWFRCTVLEISRKQLKLQYNDLEDQDGCGNLKEWVPAFRLAAPDKLGMRFLGRPTIRPCPPYSSSLETEFEVGDSVDAWWSDGWWEGIVTAVNNGRDGNLQIYVSGENLYLDVPRKDLRISKDWVGEKWVDVKANYDVLSAIDPATNVPMGSLVKDEEADHLVLENQDTGTEDKGAVTVAPTSSAGHPEQVSSLDKGDLDDDHHVNEKSDHLSQLNLCCDGDTGGNGEDHNVGMAAEYVEREDISATEVARTLAVSEITMVGEVGAKPVDSCPKDLETAASIEGQCLDDDLEAAIPSKEALQLTDVAAEAQVDQEKAQNHAS